MGYTTTLQATALITLAICFLAAPSTPCTERGQGREARRGGCGQGDQARRQGAQLLGDKFRLSHPSRCGRVIIGFAQLQAWTRGPALRTAASLTGSAALTVHTAKPAPSVMSCLGVRSATCVVHDPVGTTCKIGDTTC